MGQHERQQRGEREWRVSPIPINEVTMYKGEKCNVYEKESATLRATPGKFMAALVEALHTTLVSLYGRADASCMAARRLPLAVSFPHH